MKFLLNAIPAKSEIQLNLGIQYLVHTHCSINGFAIVPFVSHQAKQNYGSRANQHNRISVRNVKH